MSTDSFERECASVKPSWIKGLTIHHTAIPSLSDRPKGFTALHLRALWKYYTEDMEWSSGPHVFVDDSSLPIGLLTRLSHRGVHAVSFNRTHIGMELLGWYDRGKDDPKSGRGAVVWQNGAYAAAVLYEAYGNGAALDKWINFHRDDELTRKTCPGDAVDKDWFLSLVRANMLGDIKTGKPWLLTSPRLRRPATILFDDGRTWISHKTIAEMEGWSSIFKIRKLPTRLDRAGNGWSKVRDYVAAFDRVIEHEQGTSTIHVR